MKATELLNNAEWQRSQITRIRSFGGKFKKNTIDGGKIFILGGTRITIPNRCSDPQTRRGVERDIDVASTKIQLPVVVEVAAPVAVAAEVVETRLADLEEPIVEEPQPEPEPTSSDALLCPVPGCNYGPNGGPFKAKRTTALGRHKQARHGIAGVGRVKPQGPRKKREAVAPSPKPAPRHHEVALGVRAAAIVEQIMGPVRELAKIVDDLEYEIKLLRVDNAAKAEKVDLFEQIAAQFSVASKKPRL